MTLIAHCGAGPVSYQELQQLQYPEDTETYRVVRYDYMVNTVSRICSKYLGEVVDEQFAITKNGARFFGTTTFSKPNSSIQPIIGYANSIDQSLSTKLAGGGGVVVCDNMLFTGDEIRLRRHTKNVIRDLEHALHDICTILTDPKGGPGSFIEVLELKDALQSRELTDSEAGAFLGQCFMSEFLRPRQLSKARTEWRTPKHADFLPRNAWSVVNACTEALKGSPPHLVAQSHLGITRLAQDNLLTKKQWSMSWPEAVASETVIEVDLVNDKEVSRFDTIVVEMDD